MNESLQPTIAEAGASDPRGADQIAPVGYHMRPMIARPVWCRKEMFSSGLVRECRTAKTSAFYGKTAGALTAAAWHNLRHISTWCQSCAKY
jgi:hypothetical protein